MSYPDPENYSPQMRLALLGRMLHYLGYDEGISGHMTYRLESGGLLATPYVIRWADLTASDILEIDAKGRVLKGRWPVSPAITLHTVLHEERPDTRIAIHNHPRWATVWAAT